MPRARFSAHLLAASLLSLGALLSRAHLGSFANGYRSRRSFDDQQGLKCSCYLEDQAVDWGSGGLTSCSVLGDERR
jgi:hypothetical protein